MRILGPRRGNLAKTLSSFASIVFATLVIGPFLNPDTSAPLRFGIGLLLIVLIGCGMLWAEP